VDQEEYFYEAAAAQKKNSQLNTNAPLWHFFLSSAQV
jgi:hypothetical protein